jgi:transitional endoplasmic reticulum ATPase
MGKDLSQAVPETHVAEIVHHGEKLILPEGMTIQKAIDLLYRRAEYLETDVAINEKFDVFPFDGAFGLSQVIIERYGWAQGVPIQQMFGEKKPEVYKVAISPTEKVDVPWGRFELPNIKGFLETGLDQQHGRAVFTLSAVVKRKYEPTIRGLFDELRAWLREHSLYRGKAIKIRFRDDAGEPVWMPEVTFMDVKEAYPEKLLLNDDLSASLNANLFTPISRVDDCLQNGIKVKRGVLMAGKYGTGKTLAATVAAHLAEKHEVTYVYTPRAEELGDAIAFAKQYQSPACVVFCEDIDRTVQGERTVAMDDILNILDGIDGKGDNIITVLTTNHLENVNQAMLRPGRLDAIINIEPPNAKTAERLVRWYGGEAIDEDENLHEVGKALDGQIPAVIEETVKRAKLFELAMQPKGHAVQGISAEAIRRSAVTMTTQIELLKEPESVTIPTLDKAFGDAVRTAVKN